MQRGNKIGLHLCVCLSLCVSVRLQALLRSHFLIFTKIGTDVRTPKNKNEFVGGQYRTTRSPIPPQTPILSQEVLKTNANIK